MNQSTETDSMEPAGDYDICKKPTKLAVDINEFSSDKENISDNTQYKPIEDAVNIDAVDAKNNGAKVSSDQRKSVDAREFDLINWDKSVRYSLNQRYSIVSDDLETNLLDCSTATYTKKFEHLNDKVFEPSPRQDQDVNNITIDRFFNANQTFNDSTACQDDDNSEYLSINSLNQGDEVNNQTKTLNCTFGVISEITTNFAKLNVNDAKKNETFDKETELNETFEKPIQATVETTTNKEIFNGTFEKPPKTYSIPAANKESSLNGPFEKPIEGTFTLETPTNKELTVNDTLENSIEASSSFCLESPLNKDSALNGTFENPPKASTTFSLESPINKERALNGTFEKSTNKELTVNDTFVKQIEVQTKKDASESILNRTVEQIGTYESLNIVETCEVKSSENETCVLPSNSDSIEKEKENPNKSIDENSKSERVIDLTKEQIQFDESPVKSLNSENCGNNTTVSIEDSFEEAPQFPPNSKMADFQDKINQQQAEISDLKLKLNAAQQHNASLELQIRQNEEIVIKTQAEALRTEQNYQQEVKQLKEKLNENSKIIEKDKIRELEDTIKDLEEQIKDGKARENKLMAEISQKNKDELNFQNIIEQYEANFKFKMNQHKKLKEDYDTTKLHLTNLELAFSDVHSKYEKSKATLLLAKDNEESLETQLEVAHATNIQHEERYESLKAHATNQIEKANKENHAMKELHEAEVNKLKAYVRRLEIKVSALEVSLQQKSEECEQLATLCDEVTGKRV